MCEVMRVGPEQVASGQVGFGHVWVERQGLFSSRECLLLQISGLLGRDEGQPRHVSRGQIGVGTRETGIERDGAFEQRDRSLGVGVGRPHTEIPRAQHGVVRGGVDRRHGGRRDFRAPLAPRLRPDEARRRWHRGRAQPIRPKPPSDAPKDAPPGRSASGGRRRLLARFASRPCFPHLRDELVSAGGHRDDVLMVVGLFPQDLSAISRRSG